MKVALVHDWLIHMRGGEKVLEALAELFPQATLYALFYDRRRLSPTLQQRVIRASFLHYLPGIRYFYRWLLPLLPYAVRSLKIQEADLVISSSHCVAKGIQIPPKAYHICYCHTPMRYLWGFEKDYFGKMPFFFKPLIRQILKFLRRWDLQNNARVDLFVSNSQNVRERIQNFYQRNSEVVYPPLDTEGYYPEGPREDYYLIVSAFVPYKKAEIAIEAFNTLDRPLKIVGEGPMGRDYRKMSRNPRISFLGPVTGERLRKLYASAKALVFPTDEDFGIVPLEAQACGTPVIAYAKGGALESVQYGVLFRDQTPQAIRAAVSEFETLSFDPIRIRESVLRFDKDRFKEEFLNLLQRSLDPSLLHAAP